MPSIGLQEVDETHQQQSQLDETPFLKSEIRELNEKLEDANKKIEQHRKEKQIYMEAAFVNESIAHQAKQEYEDRL